MKLVYLALLSSFATNAFGIVLDDKPSRPSCRAYSIPKETLDLIPKNATKRVIYKKDITDLRFGMGQFNGRVEGGQGLGGSITLSVEETAFLFAKEACFPAYVQYQECDSGGSFDGIVFGGMCYDRFIPLFPIEGEGEGSDTSIPIL